MRGLADNLHSFMGTRMRFGPIRKRVLICLLPSRRFAPMLVGCGGGAGRIVHPGRLLSKQLSQGDCLEAIIGKAAMNAVVRPPNISHHGRSDGCGRTTTLCFTRENSCVTVRFSAASRSGGRRRVSG